MMNELMKITEEEGRQVVSARDLYSYLEIKKHFTQWFDQNKTQFNEHVDYQAVNLYVNASNGIGGTNKTDYALTIDCAKEMAMMSKVKKGKQAREYFIECEKLAKTLLPLTKLGWMELAVKTEKENLALEQTNNNLSTALDALSDWAGILKVSQHNKIRENVLNWRILKRKSAELGFEVKKVPSNRYAGGQNLYHITVFKAVYPQLNYNFSKGLMRIG